MSKTYRAVKGFLLAEVRDLDTKSKIVVPKSANIAKEQHEQEVIVLHDNTGLEIPVGTRIFTSNAEGVNLDGKTYLQLCPQQILMIEVKE